MVRVTASQIATPPIIAVGFLCQRSVLGLATNPSCLAKTLTTGVKATASTNDTTGGINFPGATEIICKSGKRSYSIGEVKGKLGV